jgi:hypothetical protein
MKILQLFKDNSEILATDGIMYVDGRLNTYNIIQAVKERNKRYAANFPHKIADSFAIYTGRIGGNIGRKYSL